MRERDATSIDFELAKHLAFAAALTRVKAGCRTTWTSLYLIDALHHLKLALKVRPSGKK